MDRPRRSLAWGPERAAEDPLSEPEWLVANGLGGYASGTVSGAVTRRYHGMLVAALPSPLGRTVMINHLSERLRFPGGETISLAGEERSGGRVKLLGGDFLKEFRLEAGLPVWRFEGEGWALEKSLLLVHLQNTLHVRYRLVAGSGPVRVELRPSLNFRIQEAGVDEGAPPPYAVGGDGARRELMATGGQYPPLRICLHGSGSGFATDEQDLPGVYYPTEEERGYKSIGDLWSPGYFHADLTLDGDCALVASTESWETVDAVSPEAALKGELERRSRLIAAAVPEAREGIGAELVLAADQFLITPAGRSPGDEARTVIAGYHWFTDWGRDTMISLEGLTLPTGRGREAGVVLRTFARYTRDGLIPNLFPEGKHEGLYHTADATLWFFHALNRYLAATGDIATLRLLLPVLVDIADQHLRGTRFNIHVDPADGLLVQGEEGYQLTWMDAKMGDWVVTPRRGKAVEINALWFNALSLLAGWLDREGHTGAERYREHAARTRDSFNRRFWCAERGYLHDLVDCLPDGGVDSACRPNQVFAISLDHAVLNEEYWEPVMKCVEEKLLTPFGLRSLSPEHPDYKPVYVGDLRSRDGAYHQGTVWAWLIGPFVDAWMKLHPGDPRAARRFLESFSRHLDEADIGSISEVFDASEPHAARGCIAQAWSVAEVLRCWVKTAG